MVAKDEGHGYQKKTNGDFEFDATVLADMSGQLKCRSQYPTVRDGVPADMDSLKAGVQSS